MFAEVDTHTSAVHKCGRFRLEGQVSLLIVRIRGGRTGIHVDGRWIRGIRSRVRWLWLRSTLRIGLGQSELEVKTCKGRKQRSDITMNLPSYGSTFTPHTLA